MSSERASHLDSSALVRLAVREPETAALQQHLRRRRPLVSSALARTEVARALLPLGPAAQQRGAEVLARVEPVRASDSVLLLAGTLHPAAPRSLDAIHLATAALLGASLARVVTYDERMATAARARRWTVVAPGG